MTGRQGVCQNHISLEPGDRADCRLRHREICSRIAFFGVWVDADPCRAAQVRGLSLQRPGLCADRRIGRARTACIASGSSAATKWSPRTARPGWFLTWIRITWKSTASRSRCRFPLRIRRAWRWLRNSISMRPSARCCFRRGMPNRLPSEPFVSIPATVAGTPAIVSGWHYEKIYTLALAGGIARPAQKGRLQCHPDAHQGRVCRIARPSRAGEPARRGFVREPAFQRDADRERTKSKGRRRIVSRRSGPVRPTPRARGAITARLRRTGMRTKACCWRIKSRNRSYEIWMRMTGVCGAPVLRCCATPGCRRF